MQTNKESGFILLAAAAQAPHANKYVNSLVCIYFLVMKGVVDNSVSKSVMRLSEFFTEQENCAMHNFVRLINVIFQLLARHARFGCGPSPLRPWNKFLCISQRSSPKFLLSSTGPREVSL